MGSPPVRRARLQEVADELRFHIVTCVEALVHGGATETEARVRAHREFGHLAATQAELAAVDLRRGRGERRAELVGDFVRDVRFRNAHVGARAHVRRRLACDASIVNVAHDPDGSVLDVGRRTRTIPPALRRALDVRDRGCRFPGCGLRFTDAHHVRHWADGGETSLSS